MEIVKIAKMVLVARGETLEGITDQEYSKTYALMLNVNCGQNYS